MYEIRTSPALEKLIRLISVLVSELGFELVELSRTEHQRNSRSIVNVILLIQTTHDVRTYFVVHIDHDASSTDVVIRPAARGATYMSSSPEKNDRKFTVTWDVKTGADSLFGTIRDLLTGEPLLIAIAAAAQNGINAGKTGVEVTS